MRMPRYTTRPDMQRRRSDPEIKKLIVRFDMWRRSKSRTNEEVVNLLNANGASINGYGAARQLSRYLCMRQKDWRCPTEEVLSAMRKILAE